MGSVCRFLSKDGATGGDGSRKAFFGQSKRGACPVRYPKQSIKVVPHLSAKLQHFAYHSALPVANQNGAQAILQSCLATAHSKMNRMALYMRSRL